MQSTNVVPWGYHTWHTFHYVAMGYPSVPSAADVAAYRAFYVSLGPVLPCKLCVKHYQHTISDVEPLDDRALASPESLFEWTVRVHNVVNERIGKPSVEVDRARDYYLKHRVPDASSATGGKGCPNLVLATFFAVFLIAAAIALAVAFLFLARR